MLDLNKLSNFSISCGFCTVAVEIGAAGAATCDDAGAIWLPMFVKSTSNWALKFSGVFEGALNVCGASIGDDKILRGDGLGGKPIVNAFTGFS